MPKRQTDTVKPTLDPHNLPPLTDSQKARLNALAAMPDDKTDYSDAPFRPTDTTLDEGYQAMARDQNRELEAREWCNALVRRAR